MDHNNVFGGVTQQKSDFGLQVTPLHCLAAARESYGYIGDVIFPHEANLVSSALAVRLAPSRRPHMARYCEYRVPVGGF